MGFGDVPKLVTGAGWCALIVTNRSSKNVGIVEYIVSLKDSIAAFLSAKQTWSTFGIVVALLPANVNAADS